MSTYAQVENNIVINTVLADAGWIAEQPGEWIEYDAAHPCSIGWSVENGVCVIPTPIPDPVDPPTID
jgi:hypothetical protein